MSADPGSWDQDAFPDRRPGRVGVVFNPSTGGDRAEERREKLRKALAEADVETIWLETTPDDPGRGQAKRAVAEGAELVIASGGDGTVMACATALAGGEVPLAILPFGTGNLVAANFDIPSDLDEALEIALICRRRRIDVGTFGDDRFVIMAGMGIDAAMMRDTDHGLKARIGPLAYVIGAARNLRRPRARFRIRLDDGEPRTSSGQGVLIGNLGRLQGGLPVLPDAVPDDGLFDVAVIRTRTLGDWAAVLLRLVLRQRQARPLVETYRARKVEVHANRPQPIQRDGDPAEPSTDLNVEVMHCALTLAVPAHQIAGAAPVRQEPDDPTGDGDGHHHEDHGDPAERERTRALDAGAATAADRQQGATP
jgi:diacylglycerol kinase family enzyme